MKKLFILVLATTLFYITPVKPAEAQYYVEKGDSLSKIAQNEKMGLKDLIRLNPHIKDPNKIRVGDYIVIRTEVETAKDLADYARSLQDITAYQYGGQNAPYSTDCSGWVQYIYKQFGIVLPRTSAQQATTGQHVPFQELQIGDLMFFSVRPDHKISHVGIKLDGDYFISNLNQKADVKILSTWAKWSREHFMWGARYKL
jgi:LysM repeat protein